MNLKEQLRVEIGKELDKLETSDMATLLRGLGIELGGDSDPLPHEVSWKKKKIYIYIYIYTHTYKKANVNMLDFPTKKGMGKYASWSLAMHTS